MSDITTTTTYARLGALIGIAVAIWLGFGMNWAGYFNLNPMGLDMVHMSLYQIFTETRLVANYASAGRTVFWIVFTGGTGVIVLVFSLIGSFAKR